VLGRAFPVIASCVPRDPTTQWIFRSTTTKLIRDTVRQFMDNEVRLSVPQRDREGRYPATESKNSPISDAAACSFPKNGERLGPTLVASNRRLTSLASPELSPH